MNIDDLFPVVFFIVFALAFGSFIYKLIKHDGFKSATFGAPIQRTFGEADGGRTTNRNASLKIRQPIWTTLFFRHASL